VSVETTRSKPQTSKGSTATTSKHRQFRNIPPSQTPPMQRAERAAVEMLGPFPVSPKARSISIRETFYPRKPIRPEIRTVQEAEAEVRKLVDQFRSGAKLEAEAPTQKDLLKKFDDARSLMAELSRILRGFDRPTRLYLSNPGDPRSRFQDRESLVSILTQETLLLWQETDGETLRQISIKHLLPGHRDPRTPQPIKQDGLLVYLLGEAGAYLDRLLQESEHDLKDAGGGKISKGGNTNIARYRSPTPEWNLVVGAWDLLERCPNSAPSAKSAKAFDGTASDTRRFTGLREFLLKLYEAATGVPSEDREVLVHEQRAVERMMRRMREIQRRLNELFLRSAKYDAGDLWAASVGKFHRESPQPGPKGANPRRVPAAIVEECRSLFRELGPIQDKLYMTGARRRSRKG
jgi:hypothetical protein